MAGVFHLEYAEEAAAFWKNIAPAAWKKYKSDPSKGARVKQSGYPSRRKRKQKSSPSCANPFHFLDKCGDYSKEKPTNCSCSQSQRPNKRGVIQDIRSFVPLIPISIEDIERTVYIKERLVLTEVKSKSTLFTTQEDLVRDQHDRGKKRKQASITPFLTWHSHTIEQTDNQTNNKQRTTITQTIQQTNKQQTTTNNQQTNK